MISSVLKPIVAAIGALVFTASATAQGLIRDAEIESILRDWTDPILEVAGLQPADVDLYIINDPSLNAFVANGQRIHLHTGLLIAADTPEQLKGVIAHETCHIACGHTVSRSRAASVASRPALVSIGLGVLAIAAGAGDAGAALIASSQQFAALNFFVHTRAEEA
ncbi:MAG: M48 family metalloprotease, partial [Pseudomonadota bacterium]|nr:M48 family metalloprotease [Pseudomonadota bacterium]